MIKTEAEVQDWEAVQEVLKTPNRVISYAKLDSKEDKETNKQFLETLNCFEQFSKQDK